MTKPKFTVWDAINAALALSAKALEEIRKLAREPGPAGADGKDGAPGKDGTGVDDWTVDFEDDGRIDVMRFWNQGKIVKEIRRKTKMMLYRGVVDAAKTYEPGDVVTWGGSSWHCFAEAKGKVDSDHFKLMVKKPPEVKAEDVAKLLLESRSEEVAQILARLLADRT